MKKEILHYLREDKYDELDIYLKQFLSQELEDFFFKKGELLFNIKLIVANNIVHLKLSSKCDSRTHRW